MTPEETTLLAAADRLRRCKSGEHMGDVYHTLPMQQCHNAYLNDHVTLADAMLAAIPAGPEPVAMELEEFAHGAEHWVVCDDGEICRGVVVQNHSPLNVRCVRYAGSASYGDVPGYPTEAAARLALAWRKWREVFGQEST